MTDATASALAETLRDRYRIERELGRGGKATVYLAHDLKHDRRVALKVLLPELAQTVGAERFLREIQIAAQLHHPHILPLLRLRRGRRASSTTSCRTWRANRCAIGLQREKQLPLADAVRIAREVADALALRPRAGRRAPRHQAGEHPALRPATRWSPTSASPSACAR